MPQGLYRRKALLAPEIAGADPDRPQLWTADLDHGGDAPGDVVGVHQQGGVRAQHLALRSEGVRLAVVQQGERVRGGARGGDAVACA